MGTEVQDPTMKELAAMCVGGNPSAGLALIEHLAEIGVCATIDMLVLLAVPTGNITGPAFDCLADALAAARSLRERLP